MENGGQPATKQDIAELRSELQSEIRQNSDQLRSEFQHGFDDLKESLRDMQTELLRAFYSFAQSTEVKLKDSEVADFMLRQRLSAVESRVTEIEKRINLPPQQTQ
jgi:ABC-type phosphate transport system auxiliary subunit